jgi:excisionase family DNA binding protein
MFLLPREAAALVGLSPRAIYRAVQRGELEAVRLCSRLRIPREAFGKWIESSRVEPGEPAPPRLPVPPPPPPQPPQPGSFRHLLAQRNGKR